MRGGHRPSLRTHRAACPFPGSCISSRLAVPWLHDLQVIRKLPSEDREEDQLIPARLPGRAEEAKPPGATAGPT